VIDILLNQVNQSEKAKKHVDDYAKKLKLTSQSTSKLQLVGGEKGGMLSSIKGLLSPRSSSTSHLGVTSKEATDEESNFNQEAARRSEMQRKRIVRFTEFSQVAGLDKISTEFFILIRNKIIDLNAQDYAFFTKNPTQYCHQQLEAFKMQKDETNTDVELFKKIEQSINSYDINLKRKIEEEKLLRESADKGEATESSSSVIDEKASVDVQADSIQVSEKTESDSSTSVETEKSED
jgi:hypothetical protein